MKIQVTQEDIKNGIRGSTTKCPVALACQRALGPDAVACGRAIYTGVVQHAKPSNWVVKEYGAMFLVPPQVRVWIQDYDDCVPVAPIEFEL